MARAGRQSNLQKYLIEGMPELKEAIRSLNEETLAPLILEVLEDIGRPTRNGLMHYYQAKKGKHDNESLKRAMQHRWWSRRRQAGLPVGFSRALAVRTLTQDGFGFKVAKLKKSEGFFMRIKAFGPGIHLIEKGRYSGRSYTGWRAGLLMLKRWANGAVAQLNQKMPVAFERAAAEAAARAGVKS